MAKDMKGKEMNTRQIVNPIIVECDEQYGSRELIRMNEGEIVESSSVLIDTISWCWSTPLKCLERSSFHLDTADSTINLGVDR